MPKSTKPVAKSLHTITVLVQVAGLHIAMQPDTGPKDAEAAMDAAMVILGLDGRPDPYELRAKALVALVASEARRAAA